MYEVCCYDNTGLVLVDCTGGHATMILPLKGHIIMFFHILQCDKNEQTGPWDTDTTVFSETLTHKISLNCLIPILSPLGVHLVAKQLLYSTCTAGS